MDPIEFELRGEFIELNQLLKLTGLCSSGGAGKMLVAGGRVKVDGQVELRKTCKIRMGQTVEFEGQKILVVSEAGG
jgi:ribosome-associated protein